MNRVLCLVACLAASALAADRPISQMTACQLRFEAFCAVMHR